MKNLSPFFKNIACSLIFTLAASPFFAQRVVYCDSLFFKNGEAQAVEIVSESGRMIRYFSCEKENPSSTLVRISKLAAIRYYDGRWKVFDATLPQLPDSLNQTALASASKPAPLKKWVFSHRKKDRIRSIMQGQKMTVIWEDVEGKPRFSNGRLQRLTADSLFLFGKKYGQLAIPGDKIKQIQVRKTSALRVALGIMSLTFAAIGLSFFGFAGLFFLLLPQSERTNEDQIGENASTGCLEMIFLMLFGFFLLMVNPTEKISKPFGPDWKVEETAFKPGTSAEKTP